MSKFIRKAVLLFLFSTAITPVFAVIRDGGVDPSNLGQGGWLYIMGDATNKLGGNVASVTNENSLFAYMKGIGFNYVIVKAGTGEQHPLERQLLFGAIHRRARQLRAREWIVDFWV